MVENCGYIDNEEGFFSSDQSLSLPGNTSESFYNNDREAVAVCQQRRMIHLLRSISESIWIYFCGSTAMTRCSEYSDTWRIYIETGGGSISLDQSVSLFGYTSVWFHGDDKVPCLYSDTWRIYIETGGGSISLDQSVSLFGHTSVWFHGDDKVLCL